MTWYLLELCALLAEQIIAVYLRGTVSITLYALSMTCRPVNLHLTPQFLACWLVLLLHMPYQSGQFPTNARKAFLLLCI